MPGSDDGAESGDGEEPNDFPGVTRYAVTVTEDTYVRGEIEVEVWGAGDPNTARSLGGSPGQFNCTVAPSHTGASCAASENGEYTGARAQHRGEARVAGRRIF